MDENNSTLILIADGWSRSVFLELLESGSLSEIQHYIIDKGGLLHNVVSNLPSVSVASHTSIITSRYQDEHMIPGHRWLDRANKRVVSYLSLNGASSANNDRSANISSVYENTAFSKAISVQGVVSRGAEIITHIPTMRSSAILKRTAKLLQNNHNSVVVTWLPKVDAVSHNHGPLSEKVKKEMIETSKSIGAMAETLISANVFEHLRILFIPDHGQRSVTKRVNLKKILNNCGLGVVVNPRKFHTKKDVVMTGGDSSAQVYFSPSLLGVNAKKDIARQITKCREIELACWNDCDKWFFANSNGLSCAQWKSTERKSVLYEIIYGSDPLEMLLHSTSENINLSEPIINRGLYPDFLHQVMRSYVENRSGDMLLFPSKGHHFGTAPRIGFRLGFHRGSHGGPTEEETIVSAAYKGFDIEDCPIRAADLLRVLKLVE